MVSGLSNLAEMNIESIKLQAQAKSAADKGLYELAAKLTEMAAELHEGKPREDLLERARHYREPATPATA